MGTGICEAVDSTGFSFADGRLGERKNYVDQGNRRGSWSGSRRGSDESYFHARPRLRSSATCVPCRFIPHRELPRFRDPGSGRLVCEAGNRNFGMVGTFPVEIAVASNKSEPGALRRRLPATLRPVTFVFLVSCSPVLTISLPKRGVLLRWLPRTARFVEAPSGGVHGRRDSYPWRCRSGPDRT